MKNMNNLLKIIAVSTLFVISNTLEAQEFGKGQRKFVRVFNIDGKKINKGYVVFINDSVLGLSGEEKITKISFNDIGRIKMKRSSGNNALMGAGIGGVMGATIGLISADEEIKTSNYGFFGSNVYTSGTSPGTGAAIGGGIGLAGGALIGLGSSLFKNKPTFIIDGAQDKWRIFKTFIEN
ncbi:MAG: hypothetical protein KC469_13365 [Flavobacteriaceae bacterium]|nr:hypothetical protein [Flavobacteriaceae bacterium]